MTRPHEFTAKIKVAAYERSGGKCEGCGQPLQVGKIEYDHRVPIAQGGESTLENCQALGPCCHRPKTARDVAQIAKTRRQRRAHIGAKSPRSIIPGSKASRWKKKLDGTVERRH